MKILFAIFLQATIIIGSYGQTFSWEGPSSSNCKTPTGGEGECINIKQCPVMLELLKTHKQVPAAAANLRKSLCGYENKIPKVCCPSSQSSIKIATTPITSSTSTAPTTVTTSTTPTTSPTSTTSTTVTTSTTPTTSPTSTTSTTPTTTSTSTTPTTLTTPIAVTTPTSTTPSSVTTSTTPVTKPLNIIENNIVTIEPTTEYYELPSPPECGTSNVPQKGIVDGRAELGAWPWVAALGYTEDIYNPTPTYWVCVGSLITSRHVLSAAHCTDHPYMALYKVRLGQVDLDVNVTEDGQSSDVYIERIIPHASYKRGNLTNDVALLRLVKDVQFSKNIQPICLPTAPDLRKKSFVGNFAVVTGWGASNKVYYGIPEDNFLKQLQYPVIDNEECERFFKYFNEIYPSELCAGFKLGGKSACQGDSGAPLMWKKRGIFYEIGILSFAWKCSEYTNVNGFTRITSFLRWIEEHIRTPKLATINSNFVVAPRINSESPPVTVSSRSKPGSDISTTTNSAIAEEKVYELLSPPNCGNTTVLEKRNNFGSWPWFAALDLRQNRTSPTQWICSGHLITSRHVITVGHCANHPNLTLYTVRLGIDDLHDNVPEGANVIDMDIEDIILHPSYTGQAQAGDIAILKLKNDVPLSRSIQPICLPKSKELREMTFINAAPSVTGWGAVRIDGSSKHQSLKNVQIPIVGNEECNKTYVSKGMKIDRTQLCAGLPQGSCLVDSGGPLIWPNSGSYYLFGLVSYALGCAQPGYPDIFTRITAYIDWIEENIN